MGFKFGKDDPKRPSLGRAFNTHAVLQISSSRGYSGSFGPMPARRIREKIKRREDVDMDVAELARLFDEQQVDT